MDTPRRRTQADRSATTRTKILAAVVQCVDELGLAGTTSQAIAGSAGVTVGAVQHHFASKADVLRAVLEDSFDRLSEGFEGAPVGDSLEDRVSVFIDRAWLHYGSVRFRSTLEIVLSARELRGATDWARGPIAESSARARRLWDSFFADSGIPEPQQRELLRFSFVTLSGMAMTTRLSGDATTQVELLKSSLVALLRDAMKQTRAN
ncbi:MAG: TetR/AcrR family transcriptional regulator [Myxococcota bacterium]